MARQRRARQFVPSPVPAAAARIEPLPAALIVARHAVPLVGLLAFGASVEYFLLLSVFDIAVSVACIAVVALAVSTRREVGDRGAVDALAALLFLFALGIAAALAFTAMFGWVSVLLASWTPGGLTSPQLWGSALAMVAFAVPGVVRQYRADMAARLDDDARRRRDDPLVGAHLLCAGFVFLLSGYAGDFDLAGRVVVAFLVTALFVFRDLRPDLVQALAPRA